ncbi:MAG TPA: DinB family protein [Candidatus Koribacter sp.]|jgi:uncharacterized damage-inducible protein DinB
MNEIARLQHLMQQTYSGNCFHGDSVAQIFNSIDVPTAIWKPEGAAHSIWQIVLHMTAWQNVIRQRLTSSVLVTLDDAHNYPAPPEATIENLSKSFDEFRDSVAALIHAIGQTPEEQLDRPVPVRGYTFDVLLHGAIHHNLYHAGQISLLSAMHRRSKQ